MRQYTITLGRPRSPISRAAIAEHLRPMRRAQMTRTQMTRTQMGQTQSGRTHGLRRRGDARRGVPAILTLIVAATVGLCGCSAMPGLTVEQLPLPAPGGIGDGKTLIAHFDNALNLPTRAKVKLNGTDVGEVSDIAVRDYTAIVQMKVAGDAQIPAGTGAQLRQATPLGDVFVALMPPANASGPSVADGTVLTGPTSAAATVEDILVSAAAVVDGGSLGSLQQIVTELSAAVAGGPSSPGNLQGAIKEFTTAISRLNANSAEVDRSFRNTSVLTADLAAGRPQIMAAINKLGPAIDTIDDQMNLILSTLDKTNSVTDAANDFLGSNSDSFVSLVGSLRTLTAELRDIPPILGPVSRNLGELTPKFAKTIRGNSVASSAKLYWLTTGFGFDSASRLPELQDLQAGGQSLEQTLTRVLAQLSGTKGCCG